MRLFGLFLVHEAVTQWRSMRFRALAAVYGIAASIPAVLTFLASGRTPRAIGPAAYNMFLLSVQPLLTALLAAGLAIDALSRERDEGSFGVLSVAPISSIGYVLRRWLSIVAICIAISLVPTILSASLAVHTRQTVPLLLMFAEGWLLSVLPTLLVSSALAIALGTITGRTVLSIIFAAVSFTIGLDTVNDVLFRLRRLHFDGPGDLFRGGGRGINDLSFAIRGYWFFDMPSDAAFLLRSESAKLLPRAGITAAITIVLLALAAFYLRRTKRDLRPWSIPETHQLRTLIRTANRIREEYAPDSGTGTADRVAVAVALALAALLTGSIIHRQSAFASLAAARYVGETEHGIPTSTSIVAESVRIDAEIELDGTLRSHATMALRNTGVHGETHLSFALNPNVSLLHLAADAGVARTHRAWERFDVELDPPLAPGQSRTLFFDLAGLPGDVDFALQSAGNFRAQWQRYLQAKESIYMTDLSRSAIMAAATEARMRLRASDIVPVLRYSEWNLKPDDQGEGFIEETIAPTTKLDLRLRHPYPIVADSCGVVATHGEIVSHCAAALSSYLLFGGPLVQQPAGSGATLAYIPAHEGLAQSHVQSLAGSIRLASEAWPRLALPPRLIFVERPAESGYRYSFNDFRPWSAVDQIGSQGAIIFVPESIFTTRKPINANVFAASIIAGALRNSRVIVPEESSFFSHFYSAVAIGRLGLRKTGAVEPGAGFPPETAPLLNRMYAPMTRMAKVLASIEYRAGRDAFVEGINDFVHATGRPGTARELLDAIGRRGSVDLTRTYADYFISNALPELTLADVTFHRAGQRWEVSGAVKNTATGEAFVPVALRTSQGSLWQTIRVDSGGSTSFTFSAAGEPHSLQLDPDRVCYRHAAIGLLENVEYRGEL